MGVFLFSVKPHLVIGLHAHRAGRFFADFLPEMKIPFVIILGGTDVTIPDHSADKVELTKKVLHQGIV
jgi:hypothetical protein